MTLISNHRDSMKKVQNLAHIITVNMLTQQYFCTNHSILDCYSNMCVMEYNESTESTSIHLTPNEHPEILVGVKIYNGNRSTDYLFSSGRNISNQALNQMQ